LRATSVRPLLAVSTQSRDLGQVEVETLDQPVDGISRSVGKHLDQVVSCEFSRRLFGVGEAGRELGGLQRAAATYNFAAVSGIPAS